MITSVQYLYFESRHLFLTALVYLCLDLYLISLRILRAEKNRPDLQGVRPNATQTKDAESGQY